MAVTQNEERARKISTNLAAQLATLVNGLYRGTYSKFTTPILFKNTDDGLTTMYYEVHPDAPDLNSPPYITNKSDNLIISRVTPTQRYQAKLTGTATVLPGDRLLTDLKRRITKDLRNAWCEEKQQAMETSADTLRKPMLLYKWERLKKKIKYPCYAQPKHDGIRGMYDGSTFKLYSRSGKVVDLPHITEALKDFGACSLDGEICFDDFTVPLPEVMEAISRKDENLKFMVFDNIFMHDKPFQHRFVNRLKGWFEPDGLSSVEHIRIVMTKELWNEHEVDAYYEAATQAGMEGIIIRNADSPYEFGRRTRFTLKYKLEYLETFAIEGYQVVPHPDGDLMQFICTFNGKQFEVVPAWKHRERRECLAELQRQGLFPDQQLEKLADMSIEYRGITPDGKPYHAVGKTKWKDIMEEMNA